MISLKRRYLQIGKKVIKLEIDALNKLLKYIDNSFYDAVEAIKKCESKVILCGVGKSGLIASKISSTLSSIGVPSFVLSAINSSHGDLGAISKKDLLILISYSGNTSELKNIIEFAKKYNVKLIGIMSKKNSLLYKNSNIKLLIPEVKESGHGIVPTSSTTIQLALGDALAISVMLSKNFTKSDFKKFHPAGSLGEKLKTVQDLMVTKNDIPFVNSKENLKKALKIIDTKKLGLAVVKNKKNETIGIFTDGDLKRKIEINKDISSIKIEEIMTKKPISVSKDTLAAKAIGLMNEKKITSLLVHDQSSKKKTIGILHIHHLISLKN